MRLWVHAIEYARRPQEIGVGSCRRGETGDGCGHGNEQTHERPPGMPQPKPKAAEPPRPRKFTKFMVRRARARAWSGPKHPTALRYGCMRAAGCHGDFRRGKGEAGALLHA